MLQAFKSPGQRNYQLLTRIVTVAPEVYDKYGKQTPKADIWSLYITMLWVLDVDKFRSRMRTAEFDSKTAVRKVALKNAVNNSDLAYLRNMAIYDQDPRASAAQMLAGYGRRDLITSPAGSSMLPLPENHFDNWIKSVRDGRSPNSAYLQGLFDMPKPRRPEPPPRRGPRRDPSPPRYPPGGLPGGFGGDPGEYAGKGFAGGFARGFVDGYAGRGFGGGPPPYGGWP